MAGKVRRESLRGEEILKRTEGQPDFDEYVDSESTSQESGFRKFEFQRDRKQWRLELFEGDGTWEELILVTSKGNFDQYEALSTRATRDQVAQMFKVLILNG